MNDNDLIGEPYFHIKSSITGVEYETVYVNEEEFKKINDFKLSELQKNNQKVIIEFYGSQISNYAIKSNNIKSVKVVKGKTDWKNKAYREHCYVGHAQQKLVASYIQNR